MHYQDVAVDGDEGDMEARTHDEHGTKEDVELAERSVKSPRSIQEAVCEEGHNEDVEKEVGGGKGGDEDVVRLTQPFEHHNSHQHHQVAHRTNYDHHAH